MKARVLSAVGLSALGLFTVIACGGGSSDDTSTATTTGIDAGSSSSSGGSSSSSSSGGSSTSSSSGGSSSSSGSSGKVDPCTSNNGGCDVNAACEGSTGSAICTCKPGWTGDGKTCTDVNECATANGGCGANATCTNTPGSRTCACQTGYADGGTPDSGAGCTDIDECAAANGGCDMNATCTNTAGSRTCACKTGYSGNGQTCTLVTTTIDADTNLSTTNTGGRACADGGDMVAYSVVALTSTTAKLSMNVSAGCLAAGDEILVLNLQGTSGANANVGNYELLTVKSVTDDTVTFAKAKTKWFGDGAADDTNVGTDPTNQRVVLQRVPRYGNLVVNANVTLIANGWDGTKGGVFALSAAGAVTVDGKIDMSGAGYRGGATNGVVNTTGQQGESIDGAGSPATQTSTAGRGGGGRGDGTGCHTNGSAGGGGGHGAAGATAEDATCGGAGGGTYGDANLAMLTLGSGGGAGGTDNTLVDNPKGGKGGAGGGIVWVRAVGNVSGTFVASGTPGDGDALGTRCVGASTTDCYDFSGPGGGGAGGAILVSGGAFNGTATADGGPAKGGYNPPAAGNSGAGGAGRVKTN